MTSEPWSRARLRLGSLQGCLVLGAVQGIDCAAPGGKRIQRQTDQPYAEDPIGCWGVEGLGYEAAHRSSKYARGLHKRKSRRHHSATIRLISHFEQGGLVRYCVDRIAE